MSDILPIEKWPHLQTNEQKILDTLLRIEALLTPKPAYAPNPASKTNNTVAVSAIGEAKNGQSVAKAPVKPKGSK